MIACKNFFAVKKMSSYVFYSYIEITNNRMPQTYYWPVYIANTVSFVMGNPQFCYCPIHHSILDN